jgi:hypothetical protein
MFDIINDTQRTERYLQWELKGIGYELFIGALSILSITNLLLLLVVQDPALETVLGVINAIMFPIFLGDFSIVSSRAESRSVTSSATLAGPICLSSACPSSR